MFGSIQDFQSFGKDQFEAASQSAAAFGQGVQKLFTETTELSRKSFESGAQAMQSLMSSKSVEGAVQVQVEYARSAYGEMVAGSTRIGGILSATAQDVFKPLEGALSKVQGAARGNVAI